jgi:hypothetical protein
MTISQIPVIGNPAPTLDKEEPWPKTYADFLIPADMVLVRKDQLDWVKDNYPNRYKAMIADYEKEQGK